MVGNLSVRDVVAALRQATRIAQPVPSIAPAAPPARPSIRWSSHLEIFLAQAHNDGSAPRRYSTVRSKISS